MADNWQFFLQKKGSRSWKAIPNSIINLPEGIYRVMASTHVKNSEVKICVLHQYSKKGESKQRFYTSAHKTDDKGLLPILPFTYLKREVWELVANFTDDELTKKTLTIKVKELPVKINKPQLQIILNQEHFILDTNNSILVSGIIKNRHNTGDLTETFAGYLYCQLRNAQTGQVLLSKQEKIIGQFPYTFTQEIDNINCSEELILGEIILVDENFDILTRECITITVNLKQLLHQGKYKRNKNQLKLIQFDKSINTCEQQYHHLKGDILPPKMSLHGWKEESKHYLDLPTFSQKKSQQSFLASNKNPSSLVKENSNNNNLFCLKIKSESVSVNQEFAKLNLEERFLSRLHDLAVFVDNQEEQNSLEAVKNNKAKSNKIEKKSTVFNQPISEIITYDQLEILSVPAPILTISQEQIRAGDIINIKVKCPSHSNPISIKLWLQDRQTRSLLTEPMYLSDFILNPEKQLETSIELNTPKGSLEATLEAVTIDDKTQRESYKTSVTLPIINIQH